MYRLVHLSLINLDGNPLSQRMASGGPKLLEVWDANNAQQQPHHQQQQHQQQPAEGGSGEPAKPKQVTAGAVAARKAEAAAYRQLLQARTQALMGHLLNLQVGARQFKRVVVDALCMLGSTHTGSSTCCTRLCLHCERHSEAILPDTHILPG